MTLTPSTFSVLTFAAMACASTALGTFAAEPQSKTAYPHATGNPQSTRMLQLEGTPADHHQINFSNLPRVPTQHAIVSDVRQQRGVNQHNYLVHFDNRFWAMWSDGPEIEDRVGQVVKYATSADGLRWSKPRLITPYPPMSEPGSPHYNTRSPEGFRYISRGFWVRNGELLALVALDEAAGFFGESLALHAFRWETKEQTWKDLGPIIQNAINNFPPKKLPGGEWAMSRRTRDYKQTGVQFLIGGEKSLTAWESVPVASSAGSELQAEEPLWWTLPDDNLVALFRDNNRSYYLYRSFSADQGRTWSTPVKTDFPDARSKLHGLRLSDGRYALVSNPNPKGRDPLTLALSEDGLVFTKMYYVVGGRHVDYPHMIEHDGYLYIAHSGGKRTVEVQRIRLTDLK